MKELFGRKIYKNIKKQVHRYKKKTPSERGVVIGNRTRRQLLALCIDILNQNDKN